MGRETQRRLALLAVVGALAASWTIALHPPSVTGVALASSTRAAVPVNNVHVRACPFPTALRSAFEAAARDASLPPALLYAVAKVESNLHQDAESSAGARGLLQVMPATGDALELDIDEPSANVLAGARYLRLLFERFKSSGVQRYVSNVNLALHSVAGCR